MLVFKILKKNEIHKGFPTANGEGMLSPMEYRYPNLMKIFKVIGVILIALVLIRCSPSLDEDPIHKLPSGKEIKIRAMGKLYFTKNDAWALTLKYETDIDLENYELLRNEVQEVWPVFRSDVEKAGLDIAVIMPTSHRLKKWFFFSTSISKNFVLTRKENGTWDVNGMERDYDSESIIITENFLEENKESNLAKMSEAFHYPNSFTPDQLNNEIASISDSLQSAIDELGVISSYELNKSKFTSAYFGVQSVSQEYWKRYPYFNQLIYDVNFSKQGRGHLAFNFSIIKNKIVLSTVIYALSEDNPEALKIFTKLLEKNSARKKNLSLK